MASFGASLAQQVGVVALLNPRNTAGLARAACVLVGAAYPVYRTFKALERRRLFDDTRDGVLTYWSIFGCLSIAENTGHAILHSFPWYYHCKLGVVVWLQTHDGAKKVYGRYIKPLLLEHEENIDHVIETVGGEVSSHVSDTSDEVANLVAWAKTSTRAAMDALAYIFSGAAASD